MLKRKVVLYLLLIVILTVYLFRHSLFLSFQYSRIRSIDCPDKNCASRIWTHRVNSIERYQFLKRKFSGFELDVIFTGPKGFAVLHPPDKVVGDTLRLETFLAQADLEKDRFWFDIRFLNSANRMEGMKVLNNLAAKYPGLRQSIMEVYFLDVAQTLDSANFKVSFNISEKWLQNLPGNKPLRDSVNFILEGIDFISQDAAHLSTIKKLFPDKKILTWDLSIKDFFDRRPIKKLLADPQVDLVLVNVKSP